MPRVAVAASSQISADAGAQIADAGGNAVDAVLAAAIVSMCTDTGIMSPGGGAFVAVWPAGQEPVFIDGYAEMPGRGLPPGRFGQAMWDVVFDYGGDTPSKVGYGSVATPGAFAGFAMASERFGRLPWADVVRPAIDWAERGFPLTGGAAEYLRYTHEAIYSWDPDSYRILHHPDGRPRAESETVHVPDLADSLGQIAREGADALYGGELGRRITAGVQAAGGLLTASDLTAYRALPRHPIELAFGDWDVAINPAPSVGGPCLAAMLALLERRPRTQVDAAAVEGLVRIQHAVLGYRARRLDGAYGELPREVEHLLAICETGDPQALLASPSTIHISGVDSEGGACALTASAGYGSGAMVPGTGIWLNNSLGEVDLQSGEVHALEPGTRLASNMAPAIARRRDGTVLAIGSPGASRITTAIVQVLWHHIHFGRGLPAAVEHPRLHVELSPGVANIAYEPGLPVTPLAGFELRPFPGPSMYFGGVQAACWSPADGFVAVGDARRAGQIALGGADP